MQIEDNKRACTVCVFCLSQNLGYSNYTQTDHEYSCLKKLNPALDAIGGVEDTHETYNHTTKVVDLSPALAAALDVALTCPAFYAGAPANIDVDGIDTDGPTYNAPRRVITPHLIIAQHITDSVEAAEIIAAQHGWVKAAEPIQRALPPGEAPV